MNAKFQVPNTKWEYNTPSTSLQKITDNNEPCLLTVLHHTGTLGSNGKGYGGQVMNRNAILSIKDRPFLFSVFLRFVEHRTN